MQASTTTRARRPRERGRALAVLAVAGLALVACSTGDEGQAATTTSADAAPSTTQAPATTEPDDDEPEDPDAPGDVDCPGAADVEALVGSPVDRSQRGGGSGSTDGPSTSSEGCGYRLGGDGGSVGVERVTLESEEDGLTFDVLADDARADAAEDGFAPIDDLGDEAYRDGAEAAVLVGPTMAFVAVEPAGGIGPDDEVQVRAWVDQVAGDLVALDLTLDTDDLCDEVADIVAGRVGAVAEAGAQQGGRTLDDVSFDTTGCRVELTDGGEVEIDLADSGDWDAWVAAHLARGVVTYEGASIGELAAFDTGSALVVDDDPDRPLRITTDDLDLEPDEAAELRRSLAELALGR